MGIEIIVVSMKSISDAPYKTGTKGIFLLNRRLGKTFENTFPFFHALRNCMEGL